MSAWTARCRDRQRVTVNDGDERLQIERHRPHRVQPTTARNELEITINVRIPSA